jgi:hypothetical protein
LNGSAAGHDIEIPVPFIGSQPIAIGRDDLVLGDEPDGQLDSAKITIQNPLPGDMLQVDLQGTSIAAAYSDGALSLTGADSVARYQQVLRSLRFATNGSRLANLPVSVSVVVKNGSIASLVANSTIFVPGSASVLDRNVFYNNSGLDGANAGIGPDDDLAIATDKIALFPGQAASFVNYTSYNRGINGIMLDIAGTHGAISADDFTFKVGNDNSPETWNPAPAPLSVGVRAGAGLSGSDRVEIVWADGAIKNTWLQVTLAANGNTGLASSDTFYFGNAIGDTGNSPTSAAVTAQDVAGTIWHVLRQTSGAQSAVSSFDHNRDGKYTGRDVLIAIQPLLRPQRQLELISPPGGAVVSPLVSDSNAIAFALAAQSPSNLASEPARPAGPLVVSAPAAPDFPGLDDRSVARAMDQWPDALAGCWLDEDEPDVEETADSLASASLDRPI